jgi:hypothetical protein
MHQSVDCLREGGYPLGQKFDNNMHPEGQEFENVSLACWGWDTLTGV